MSEMSNSLSVVVVPAQLSKDFMGFEPPTIVPEFVGTLVSTRVPTQSAGMTVRGVGWAGIGFRR